MKTIIAFTLLAIGSLIMNAQMRILLTNGEKTVTATLTDNKATRQLITDLQKGSITVDMSEYGGFEMVGALPWSLPTENRQTTTGPGDIMLYQGSNIVIFYGSNSWNYTPIGKIDGATASSVKGFLGTDNIKLTVTLEANSGIESIYKDAEGDDIIYDLEGNKVNLHHLSPGIYIRNGKKILVK